MGNISVDCFMKTIQSIQQAEEGSPWNKHFKKKQHSSFQYSRAITLEERGMEGVLVSLLRISPLTDFSLMKDPVPHLSEKVSAQPTP